MSWKEIKALDKNTIFFITVGSIEAHGPHLPIATDFLIAKKIEEEMVKKFNGISLPSLPYTKCHYLENFAGTVSFPANILKNSLVAIMKSLGRQGFKYLVICNFHMDLFHLRAIYKAIAKGRRYGMTACEPISVAYFNKKIFEDIEGEMHADEKETSIALYLFPDLVKNYETLKPFKVNIGIKNSLRKFDKIGAENAYIGSPSNATKEKGKKYFGALLKACEEGIENMMNGKIDMPEKLKIFLRI